jgi:hypothetical protein
MSKKTKKKSTTASVSALSLPSKPAPASSETAQPPLSSVLDAHRDDIPLTEEDIEACKQILGDTFSHCHTALNAYLSDRQNVTLIALSRFFWYAFELGKYRSQEESDKVREEGVLEGKKEERLKWIEDGHIAGKECRANWNERKSVSVEMVSEPHPVSHAHSPTTTTAVIHTGPVIDKPRSFDWAEEMSTIPIRSTATAPHSAPPIRDISALRSSESVKPFASLQRHHFLTSRSHSYRPPHASKVKYLFSKLPSHMSQPSSSNSQDTPPCFSSQSSSHSCSHYNWASNLFVLSDLATALGEMGWRPPGFFHPRF